MDREYVRQLSRELRAAHSQSGDDLLLRASLALAQIADDDTPTRSEYWAHVQAIAEHLVARALDTGEDMEELLAEGVDGDWWNINYYHARFTLLFSDNEDEYFEVFGEGPNDVESAGEIYCLLAYAAQQADVRDAMMDYDAEKIREMIFARCQGNVDNELMENAYALIDALGLDEEVL